MSVPVLKAAGRAAEKYSIPHDYFVLPHSGHGLQNDSKLSSQYMDKVVEYLDQYLG